MDGWEIARKDRVSLGNKIRSLRLNGNYGERRNRSPSPNESRKKKELQKLLPLTSCLHGRVNSAEKARVGSRWAPTRVYDQKELVRALREHRVTPHVAQKVNGAIDRRSTRHRGYRLSQCGANEWKRSSAAQDGRRLAQDSSSGNRSSRLDLHFRGRGLQLGENG